MRHEIELSGSRFGLRPVRIDDAEFIVELRTDPSLNRFLHATSPSVDDQKAWIERYLDRPGDWYFIIADRVSDRHEGAIGIYDFDSESRTAEWGRWILRPNSLAPIESTILIYRVAFEILDLAAIYCRTVAENKPVVSFHDSSGAPRRALLRDHVEIGGRTYDSVEHRVDRAAWNGMRPRLESIAERLARVAEQRSASCSRP